MGNRPAERGMSYAINQPLHIKKMAKKQTPNFANSNLLEGSQLYIERAKATLPYLVRQAKARETIVYSALANAVGMRNARNMNFVLGAIGKAVLELGEQSNTSIPPIQCLVVSKKDGIPGDGVGWFIDKPDYDKLNKTQKEALIEKKLQEIYNYPNWDCVLDQLGLEPIPPTTKEDLLDAGTFGGGGESKEHKLFKEYIASNPQILGLFGIDKVETEVVLASADRIDVVFYKGDLTVGIEVKSMISPRMDIIRGLFQCVKYRHLIEATQIVENKYPNSRVILALQGQMPRDLIDMKNMLGIEVIDLIL